jgi:hypothetical protein
MNSRQLPLWASSSDSSCFRRSSNWGRVGQDGNVWSSAGQCEVDGWVGRLERYSFGMRSMQMPTGISDTNPEKNVRNQISKHTPLS